MVDPWLSGLRKADIGMGRAGVGKHGTVIRRLRASEIAFQELHPPSFALPSVAIAVHVGLNLGLATAARSDDCAPAVPTSARSVSGE